MGLLQGELTADFGDVDGLRSAMAALMMDPENVSFLDVFSVPVTVNSDQGEEAETLTSFEDFAVIDNFEEFEEEDVPEC